MRRRRFPVDSYRFSQVEAIFPCPVGDDRNAVLRRVERRQITRNTTAKRGVNIIYSEGFIETNVMTSFSLLCCNRNFVSCMTSESFGLAEKTTMSIQYRHTARQFNEHLLKNSSTTSAVSSKTLSKEPFTSFATRRISGACLPALDSSRRALSNATFLMIFVNPASFRSASPYRLRM